MTPTTPSPISDQAAGEPKWRSELRRIADDYQPEGLQAILALEEMRQALRELLESTACDCGVSCQDKGEGNCRYTDPALGIDVEFVKNPVHGGFNIRKWSARGELSEGEFVLYAAPIRVPGSLSDDQAARIFSCAKEWTDEWSERESSGTGINPSAELVNAMFVRTVLSMLRSTAPTTGSAPVAYISQYNLDLLRDYGTCGSSATLYKTPVDDVKVPLYAAPLPIMSADSMTYDQASQALTAFYGNGGRATPSMFAAPASPAAIRPTREHAEKAISDFLKGELGEVPNFTLTEDGDEDSGDKCGWAFWVLSDDTTSYLHRNLKIEWYGTAHAPEPKIAASPAASVLSEDAILAIAIDHGLGTAVVESIVKALLAASMGGDKV